MSGEDKEDVASKQGETKQESAQSGEADTRVSPANSASQFSEKKKPSRMSWAAAAVCAILLIGVGFGFALQQQSGSVQISSATAEDATIPEPADDAGGASAVEADTAAATVPAEPESTGDIAGGATVESDISSSVAPEPAATTKSDSVSSTGAESSTGTPKAEAPAAPVAPTTLSISVSVDSSAVGGSVSANTHTTLPIGATAYDALCATGLAVNARSSQYGIYVAGIGGLVEKQHGSASGWLYAVNGKTPSSSAGSYVLADGDAVSWFYTAG